MTQVRASMIQVREREDVLRSRDCKDREDAEHKNGSKATIGTRSA
jgi:hypothetical protein